MTRIERNLTALAIGILIGVIAASAFATVETVAPIVVEAAAVAPPAAAPAAPSIPAPAAPTGSAESWIAKGGAAFIGVAVYFYAVICTAERGNNPGSWFAEHCRPQDWWPK